MMNAWGTVQRLEVTAMDRWTSIIPLFHCAGCIMNTLACLTAGATYLGMRAFDAGQMLSLIERERCTVLTGVPTSYLAMLEHPTDHISISRLCVPVPAVVQTAIRDFWNSARGRFLLMGWCRFTGRRKPAH